MHRHKWEVLLIETQKSPFEVAIEHGRTTPNLTGIETVKTFYTHETVVHDRCMVCYKERVRHV